MKILYCGDSDVGGPANYLRAILRKLNADVTHIPPGRTLRTSAARVRYSAIILSDFSRCDTPSPVQKILLKHVSSGTGLLMIGGWGSFQGPFGKWRGSLVEKALPVSCLTRDDRVQISSGLTIVKESRHSILRGLPIGRPPVVCGLNEVRVKKEGRVVLTAQAIRSRAKGKRSVLAAYGKKYPLLIVHRDARLRVAALTTDFAPHWCGGLVDWGNARVKLPVTKSIGVEVGNHYIRFVSNIIRWAARA